MELEFYKKLGKLQGQDELTKDTLLGDIRKMNKLELGKLQVDSNLRIYSEKIFTRWDVDNDGSMDIDEFVALCNWVDPKWDKITCIKK